MMEKFYKFILFSVICPSLLTDTVRSDAVLTVSDQEKILQLGESAIVEYCITGSVSSPVNVSFEAPAKDVLLYEGGTSFIVTSDTVDTCQNLTFDTVKEGIVTLATWTNDTETVDVSEAFIIFSVMKDSGIDTAAMVLGWISTIAWDISFLPQIWHNHKRRSVSGLSFDFLTFNFWGFTCYFIFNAGMFWNAQIQEQFTIRHPNEVLHVRLNDVIFPLYAVICTAIQIVQCFFYQRDPGQRVSIPCRIITAILVLVVIVGCILVPTVDDFLWIDVLYLMSYIKLFISMIKYTPQLYINFKTKSTAGWSIGQVILDFTGGLTSLIQMFLIGANYDDIQSILTDPTKLGLALLSMFFNIFFFIQHYFLYKRNERKVDEEKKSEVNEGYESEPENELQVVVVANDNERNGSENKNEDIETTETQNKSIDSETKDETKIKPVDSKTKDDENETNDNEIKKEIIVNLVAGHESEAESTPDENEQKSNENETGDEKESRTESDKEETKSNTDEGDTKTTEATDHTSSSSSSDSEDDNTGSFIITEKEEETKSIKSDSGSVPEREDYRNWFILRE